jgi:hypothetical protein
MFVVSAAVGEMVIPLIVGKLFDYIGPISFLAEGCILCFAAFGVLLAVLIVGKGLSNTSRGAYTIDRQTDRQTWSSSMIRLEFRMLIFAEGGKPENPGKNPRHEARERINDKLNSRVMPSRESNPRSQW